MLAEQAGADGHERRVTPRAGGERVGLRRIEDADFRHADAGELGLLANGVDQPALGGVRRLGDDLHAHHSLGRPLGHCERDEGAGEAHHRGKHQQRAEVQVHALRVEDALEPDQAEDDPQQHDDGQVGGEEQRDSLHLYESPTHLKGCDRCFGAIRPGSRSGHLL
jgi:hypothetical protein